jgi:hypothetical protein
MEPEKLHDCPFSENGVVRLCGCRLQRQGVSERLL